MAYLAIALAMYDSAASDNASLVVPLDEEAKLCDAMCWPGLAGLDCHYEPSTGV